MNEHQKNIARHALGFDGKRTHSYRNCYVTGPGNPDHQALMEMVAAGDAIRRDGAKLPYGGSDLFHMTLTGARKALLPAETLDREDFPQTEVS